ncbi:MAG: polyphosphate kinase 2 family protein [Alphaproteobacteria bacterium]
MSISDRTDMTAPPKARSKAGPRLSGVDLDAALGKAAYKSRLDRLEGALRAMQLGVRRAGIRGVVVLEGWDAAGKGGAIRRLTADLDPRACKVWPIGAPDPAELGHHFLHRFWQRLPQPGTIAIFDRSWYGRVLVERVESLIPAADWERAYGEIRSFERMLTDDGVRLVKLFLHVSPEEQLKRFRARFADPLKRWKLTEEDFRNRARRADYETAIDRMFAETSTVNAPWTPVPAEDKKFARIAVLETVSQTLSKGLDLSPPPPDPAVAARLAEEAG